MLNVFGFQIILTIWLAWGLILYNLEEWPFRLDFRYSSIALASFLGMIIRIYLIVNVWSIL